MTRAVGIEADRGKNGLVTGGSPIFVAIEANTRVATVVLPLVIMWCWKLLATVREMTNAT
jgi:hypothetical protein